MSIRNVSLWFAGAMCAALPVTASAQVTQLWSDSFTEPVGLADRTSAALLDDAGNLVLAVDSQLPSVGTSGLASTRIRLLAYGPDGSSAFQRSLSFGNFQEDVGDLARDPNNGELVIAGTRAAVFSLPVETGLLLVRCDALGQVLASTTFDVAGQPIGSSTVAVANDGSIFVLARIAVGTAGDGDLLVAKYSSALAQVWTRTVHDGSNLQAIALTPAPGGGVVIVGSFVNILVAKFDDAGNEVWRTTRPGRANQVPGHGNLALDDQGRIYVAGGIEVAHLNIDALLVQFDGNGVEQWARTFDGGVNRSEWLTVVRAGTGGRVVAAGTASRTPTVTEALVLSYDTAGASAWVSARSATGNHQDAIESLALDTAGGIAISGLVSNGSGSTTLVQRLDRDGNSRWIHIRPLGTALAEQADFVGFARGGDVVVAGLASRASEDVDAIAYRLHEQGVPFCFGDDSRTPCPCGNVSASFDQAGCRNSRGSAAHLIDQGVASLSADTLALRATGMPGNGSVLFLQGTLRNSDGAGAVFGDGLLCVDGTLIRLGSVAASGGTASFGHGTTPPISSGSHVTMPGRYSYQALYRDTVNFCTGADFNTTNGLEVTWTP